MALDPKDRDLALLAARSTPDAFLNRLLTLARVGVGWSITVVLGGTIITGDLVGPLPFAENLDAKMLEPIDARLATEGDDLRPVRDQLAENSFADRVRESLKETEDIFDRADAAEGELEEDLERDLLQAEEFAALSLQNARVFPPSLPAFDVDMIRVHVASVDAWWLGRTVQS